MNSLYYVLRRPLACVRIVSCPIRPVELHTEDRQNKTMCHLNLRCRCFFCLRSSPVQFPGQVGHRGSGRSAASRLKAAPADTAKGVNRGVRMAISEMLMQCREIHPLTDCAGHTFEIVSAGLHWSFKISKQMPPLALISVEHAKWQPAKLESCSSQSTV